MKWQIAIVCLAILFAANCPSPGKGQASEAKGAPVILDWSSHGGRVKNKEDERDRMYLVQSGDRIIFRVKARNAREYEWQVNKVVQEGVKGSSFTWVVPEGKGIWEIHVVVRGEGGEAHHEWVVSNLSGDEAPDFFDYFTDGKWRDRSETDPWGRPLPEWKPEPGENACDSSACYLSGKTWLWAPSSTAYGTWRLKFMLPAYKSDYSNPTRFRWRYINCAKSPDAYLLMRTNDTHDYFKLLHRGHYWIKMCEDNGYLPFENQWYEATVIRTPDGWLYNFENKVEQPLILKFIYKETAGRDSASMMLAIEGKEPHRVRIDCIEVYKGKYLFPEKRIYYGEFIDNWVYVPKDGYYPIAEHYQPIKKKGIIIRGRGVRLKDIADAIGDEKLFSYDTEGKIAICRTNLVIMDAAELILDGEELRIHSTKPGEHEIAVMYGATLRVKNSTISSADENYFLWRISSTVHHGLPGTFVVSKKFPGNSLRFSFRGSIFIEGSKINNCGFMFFDSPHELVIRDSQLTNLHEVDVDECNYDPEIPDDEIRERKAFVKGKKALWVFYKNFDLVDFTMENLLIKGARSPINITFMLNSAQPGKSKMDNILVKGWREIAKINIYNVDASGENIVVRKSRCMYSAYRHKGEFYPSFLGLVNCKYKSLIVPTDMAYAIPKYYLDVKVVNLKGVPVPGAKVKVRNEVDDRNYPAENKVKERFHDLPLVGYPHTHLDIITSIFMNHTVKQ